MLKKLSWIVAIVVCTAIFVLPSLVMFAAMAIFSGGGISTFSGDSQGTTSADQDQNSSSVCEEVSFSVTVPKIVADALRAASDFANTDLKALTAVYWKENGERINFDLPPPYGKGPPWRCSEAGACGPLQFMQLTWEAYKSANPSKKPGDINDIKDAAYAAASYLSFLGATKGAPLGSINDPFKKGTVINALRGYNGGPYNTEIVEENRNYFTRAAEFYSQLKIEKPSAGSSTLCGAQQGKPGASWSSPIGGMIFLTSGFGPRWGAFHRGLDFGAPAGTPIFALTDGVVLQTGAEASMGNYSVLSFGDGLTAIHMHQTEVLVRKDQRVKRGEKIGTVGNTGNSYGAHLHLQLNTGSTTGFDGTPVDPYPLLKSHGVSMPARPLPGT